MEGKASFSFSRRNRCVQGSYSCCFWTVCDSHAVKLIIFCSSLMKGNDSCTEPTSHGVACLVFGMSLLDPITISVPSHIFFASHFIVYTDFTSFYINLFFWQDHWSTYIVEDDFKFISSSGLTAVRIPVGWWIASDPNPPAPYV
uniref:Uncharacterized protein n=1 Tax=Arundo donax TaxID=35708 RepID=A0A0A8YJN0_ARUDO